MEWTQIKSINLDLCCDNDLNPLPDDKILDWFKLKQIADHILKWI